MITTQKSVPKVMYKTSVTGISYQSNTVTDQGIWSLLHTTWPRHLRHEGTCLLGLMWPGSV